VWAALTASVLLVTGCATVAKDYPRTASTALEAHESTAIGRDIAALAEQHPGASGFAILRRGRAAFTARVAMADLAQRSLDLQYFLWEHDATALILSEHVLRAADRGVRVRVLLDDVSPEARDGNLASLGAHPNVEIRVFNPFPHRGPKVFGFLTSFNRVNHRMHNKLIVMDNTLAIVGGRNISDAYFEVDPVLNYRDLDVVGGGPIVRELSRVFDRFWNGEWSVPVAALVDRPYSEDDLRLVRQRRQQDPLVARYPHPLGQDLATLKAELSTIIGRFVWAPGQVVFDDPSAIDDSNVRVMQERLFRRVEQVESEVLVESAYFIPLAPGVDRIRALVERGVRVRVVTNSLASNDVLPAFAGYSISRKALIRAGVEVHEVRWEPGPLRKQQILRGSRTAVHTKTIVFDRKDVFIGSFNLDARSALINTEAGLYIESPELAAQVVEYLDEGAGPEISYRVLLDDDGELYWIAADDGAPLRYDTDPLSTRGQRFKAGIWRILPILDQL